MDEYAHSQKLGGAHMNPIFHRFVDQIVKQTDGNQAERDDLYEELMVHLEMSSERFIKEGFNEKQAEQKAMEHFGEAGEIGSQIQQAMFPFRKTMMLTLATTSIIFSFGAYLAQLFLENNALIIWLIISIANSSLMFICAVQPVRHLNRRLWLNAIFIMHIFVYSYGWMIASDIDHPISIVLTLLSWFIILLGIALLYLTTINDYQSSKQTHYKQANRIHVLNITTGIVLVIATLFFLWGLLVFSEERTPAMFTVFIPLFIWMIAYFLQINFLSKNKKKVAYAIAAIPILILTIIFGWLVLVFFWRGP